MTAYYNEIDHYAAAWLQALMDAGHIANGHIDTRSIKDVTPADLVGYDRCHFFAGIGGWDYALRLAGWPDDRPVWTGSCPCQPYSSAGKGLGDKDPRNLWPDFYRLIRECRPECVFGEQVASAIGHGWLDGVSADMEAEDYAVGACVLGAHSVGAPIIRQRLYWISRPESKGQGPNELLSQDEFRGQCESGRGGGEAVCGMEFAAGVQCLELESPRQQSRIDENPGTHGRMGCTEGKGPQRKRRKRGAENGRQDGRQPGLSGEAWDRFQLVYCTDGALRRVPIEPAFFPLADGVPARVVRLRGYGNAIVPQVAATFIRAFMETEGRDV